MKNKKAAILVLALGLVGSLGLAACGGKNDDSVSSSVSESNSSESSAPVGGEEAQGETIADETAWAAAINNTLAKTNATVTYTMTLDERMGECFMYTSGSATAKVADGKVYQSATGHESCYYPSEEGTFIEEDDDFSSEMYISIVDDVAIEWDRYDAGEWYCAPYEGYESGFTPTVGGLLHSVDIYLEYFVETYSAFENVDGTYVLEMTDLEMTDGGTDYRAELKFVNGLLYSYVMETVYTQNMDGQTATESMEVSMTFTYDNATVGELPPMTWDGEEECSHSFTYYESNGDATCTEDGTKTAYCDYGCGADDTIADEGSKLEHSFTYYVSNDDATCTEDGTKTAYCDYSCGADDTITDEGSKREHSFTDYKSNGDATCTEDGTKTAICDNGCGETDEITDDGSATGHSFTDYKSNGNATCTADGTKTATCDRGCGETDEITDEGSATGHSFTDYKTDDSGKQTAICDNGCGATDVKGEAVIDEEAWRKAITDSVNKTNATVGYVSALEAEDEVGNYFGQTGTAKAKLAGGTLYELVTGLTSERGLNVYNEPFMTETYIGYVDNIAMQWYRESVESAWDCGPFDPDGEEFTGTLGEFMEMRSIPLAYFADMFAVFTYEDGTYVYETDITNNGEVGRIEIKFLNGLVYSYEQTVTVNENVEGIDADAIAYMNFIISYDDADVMELPAMTWEIPVSGGLEFTLNSDGKSYSVTGIGSCEDPYVVIPKTYANYPVTGIGASAFAKCSSVTEIVIPDSVTSIGASAFANCSNLAEIVIPDSVKSIGKKAFNKCTALTKVYIRDAVAWSKTSFEDGANPLEYAKNLYINNQLVTKLVIPDGETAIASSAFANCSSLTEVVIPDSITSIGSNAFKDCNSLTGVYITDVSAWCNISFGNYAANPLSCAKKLYVGTELVTKIEQLDNVTTIGDYVFYNCEDLTEIVIPDSVTSLGKSAFYNCSGLTEVIIPEGVKSMGSNVFANCSNLSNIVIPDSMECIGANPFYKCFKLQYNVKDELVYVGNEDNPYVCLIEPIATGIVSATPAEGCKVIGDYAFDGCNSLMEIVIPDSVTSIGNYAFKDCRSLVIYCEAKSPLSGWSDFWNPSDCPVVWDCNNNDVADDGYIYTVANGLFYGIKGGTAVLVRQVDIAVAVDIPSEITYKDMAYSVTSIGDYAFENNESLTEIVIPENITNIGELAFYNCSALTKVTIGNGVERIGNNAFYGCPNLQYNVKDELKYVGNEDNPYVCLIAPTATGIVSATLAEGCKVIGDYAFYCCYSLKEIVFAESVTVIGNSAFDWCSALTEVVLPDGVTTIGQEAFQYCGKIKNLIIPDSVTCIGAWAFQYCTGLTNVTCPMLAIAYLPTHGLKEVVITSGDSIGDREFEDSVNLTKIVLPDSITSIGSYAFFYCSALTSIVIPSGVTEIGDHAFWACSALKTIEFDGTKTQWDNITKGSWWNANILATSVICTDGEVAL